MSPVDRYKAALAYLRRYINKMNVQAHEPSVEDAQRYASLVDQAERLRALAYPSPAAVDPTAAIVGAA